MIAINRRPGPFATVVTLAAFCLLVGLGVWQVQRLKWKTDLLRRIEALKISPAEPLEVVLRRVPDGGDISYVRVQLACPALEQTPTLRVYSLQDGETGYRLVTACALPGGPYGSVLVDRGFLPTDQAAAPGRAALAAPVIGVLRKPDGKTIVSPPNQPAKNLWYWRDLPAMAAALRAERPAPVFLMLESPAPAGPWPKPAPVPVDIPNSHLGYAITWFGLAAALAGVYLALLFRKKTS